MERFYHCFYFSRSSNPALDGELLRPTDDLSKTGSIVLDRHMRALSAVSAYGSSVALNRTRQRPVSASILSTQGKMSFRHLCSICSLGYIRLRPLITVT